MKILVVCGAGASSTFVAQRVRRAALGRGIDLSASAGTSRSIPNDLDAADLVLVGAPTSPSTSSSSVPRLRRARALVVLLPDDVFTDLDGTRTLALVEDALRSPSPRTRSESDAETMPHLTRTVRIGSSRGLHARPAKLFAQSAKDAGIR